MTLVYSLAEVERTVNGSREIVQPNEVFDLDDNLVKGLTRLRAVRAPTDSEIALYEKQGGRKAAPAAKVSETEPRADKPAPRRGRGRKVADL